MSALSTYAAVALGGATGSMLRFAVGRWSAQAFGPAFPWGTLAVNVLGGFAMGLAAQLLVLRDPAAAPWLAAGAMSGLLGGFTTFSAFSLDTLTLFARGETARAAAYVLLSLAVSLGACALGALLGRSLP